VIVHRADAVAVTKQGVDMWIYNGADTCPQAAVAYQETQSGHTEEFYHDTSAFIFYIIEGRGTWVIEDEAFPVEATDVVIVPPGARFYYRGALKQVCITAPAWDPKHEHHVANVEP
jgi:mannose-6-phosphate isomerase-like protein (cupin superfamily)